MSDEQKPEPEKGLGETWQDVQKKDENWGSLPKIKPLPIPGAPSAPREEDPGDIPEPVGVIPEPRSILGSMEPEETEIPEVLMDYGEDDDPKFNVFSSKWLMHLKVFMRKKFTALENKMSGETHALRSEMAFARQDIGAIKKTLGESAVIRELQGEVKALTEQKLALIREVEEAQDRLTEIQEVVDSLTTAQDSLARAREMVQGALKERPRVERQQQPNPEHLSRIRRQFEHESPLHEHGG